MYLHMVIIITYTYLCNMYNVYPYANYIVYGKCIMIYKKIIKLFFNLEKER